eukprot:1482389-Amphidinium_carterae.1
MFGNCNCNHFRRDCNTCSFGEVLALRDPSAPHGVRLITLLGTLPLLGHITRQYGRAFHLRVTLARPPYSGWPNDLEVPHTDPSDLLEQDSWCEPTEQTQFELADVCQTKGIRASSSPPSVGFIIQLRTRLRQKLNFVDTLSSLDQVMSRTIRQ